MECARLIRKLSAAARAGSQLLQHAEQSVPAALFAVAAVTMASVACAGSAKLREPPSSGGRDPEWWVLAAASGVAMASVWVAITMAVRPDHRPRRGRVFLGVAVAALLATVAVSELDLELLLELMEAMLGLHHLPNHPA